MNRVALSLALFASAATGAAVGVKLDPEVFRPVELVDITDVGVLPNGACPVADDAGVTEPAIPGGADGTCFQTVAHAQPRSLRVGLQLRPIPHLSTTKPESADALLALLVGVVLPAVAAQEPLASNPDLFEVPAVRHLKLVRVNAPGDARAARLWVEATVPSLRAGIPAAEVRVSQAPPTPALDAMNALVAAHVLPALAEQTGLR